MDLNSLARTLAERLQAELSICMETGRCEVCINGAEAVIREAIDKTLDEAAGTINERLLSQYEENGCAGTALRMAISAIRSLKQSNSGMEVRK